MRDQLMDMLRRHAEPQMAAFTRKVVCDTGHRMIYVRVPRIRAIARGFARTWRRLLDQAQFEYYEEVMAVGLAIAYAREPLADKLDGIRRLLPWIDSWALTDTIVPTLKVGKDELPTAWEFAGECQSSGEEYTIRFGIIMMLTYFLTPEHIPAVEARLKEIRDDRYYVRTAVAWTFAEMGVRDFDRVSRVLENGELDVVTHNMTIQKLRDSRRISPRQKEAVRPLRRKEMKL